MPKFVDFTGKKIGRLSFIGHEMEGKKRRWLAECECGNKQSYRVDYFCTLRKRGKIFECYECKMSRRFPALLDKKYGRLTVLSRDHTANRKGIWYLCQCDCGKTKSFLGKSLTREKKPTRSCGCFMRKLHSRNANTTQYPPDHGFKSVRSVKENKEKYRIYNARTALAAACYCPTNCRYKHVGAKGYTLCDLWRNGVKDFYEWAMANGYGKGKGIYLRQGETEYGPSTCYIQEKSQASKAKNSKLITFKGETLNISEWASILGVSISCLSIRLRRYRKKYGLKKAMDTSWVPERNQSHATDKYEEQIVDPYKKGYTYKAITEKLGCGAYTIKRFLIKNKVPIRPPVQTPVRSKKTCPSI